MTKLKRTALTLPYKTDETLRKLSYLTGKPKSTLITEHLNEMESHFSLMVKHLEEVRRSPERAKELADKYFAESMEQINDASSRPENA